MTDRRPAETKLLEDARKAKQQRDYWRDLAQHRAELIAEAQMQAIAYALRDRLVRVEYFTELIGLENVHDDSGHLDWAKLEREVDDLLARRPELGVSLPPNVGGPT